MAFLARTTDLSGKLPVLAFGSTFKKNGDGIQLRRYNGYVLLEVNGLESQSEAEAVRREAAALPQTLLAFVGLSGRSVKIVVPFVLPDGSLPKKEEQARIRKRENELKKTEKAIEELETRDKEIDEELAKPEVATDPSKCIPLSAEKGEIAEKLEELYEKWEELAQ